jgi:hypothetical protein
MILDMPDDGFCLLLVLCILTICSAHAFWYKMEEINRKIEEKEKEIDAEQTAKNKKQLEEQYNMWVGRMTPLKARFTDLDMTDKHAVVQLYMQLYEMVYKSSFRVYP